MALVTWTYHTLLTRSSVDGQSDFHFLAIVRNAALSTGHKFVCRHVFLSLGLIRGFHHHHHIGSVENYTWAFKKFDRKRHTLLLSHFTGQCRGHCRALGTCSLVTGSTGRGEQEVLGVSRSNERRREVDILATQENDSVWIGHSEKVY